MPTITEIAQKIITDNTANINLFVKDFINETLSDPPIDENMKQIEGQDISVKVILQELFNMEDVQGNLNTENLNSIATYIYDLELLEKTMRHQSSGIDIFISLYQNLVRQFLASPTDEKRESLNKFQEALFEYVVEKIDEKNKLKSFYEKITDPNVLVLFISKLDLKKEEHIGIAEELLKDPTITDEIISQSKEKVRSSYDEITENSTATSSELSRVIKVQSDAVNKITTKYIEQLNIDLGVLLGKLKFLNRIVAEKKLLIAKKSLTILVDKLTSEKLHMELSNFDVIEVLKKKATISSHTNQELVVNETIQRTTLDLTKAEKDLEALSTQNKNGQLVPRQGLSDKDKKERSDLVGSIAAMRTNLMQATKKKELYIQTHLQQLSSIKQQLEEKQSQIIALSPDLISKKTEKESVLAYAQGEYKEAEFEARYAFSSMGDGLTEELNEIVSMIEAEAEAAAAAEAEASSPREKSDVHLPSEPGIGSMQTDDSQHTFTPGFDASSSGSLPDVNTADKSVAQQRKQNQFPGLAAI